MEKVLFVDDDASLLDGLRRSLRKQFDIYTALGAIEAQKVLEVEGPFPVVVSDYRMPDTDGLQFLRRVQELYPETVRILLTGQADLTAVMEAINQDTIFRFLMKPCDNTVLTAAVTAGFTQYRLIQTEKDLLNQTLGACLRALNEVLLLTNPEANGRAARTQRLMLSMLHEMSLSEDWNVEMAAMLSQIGCVALPKLLLKKLIAGEQLTQDELDLYNNHPTVGAAILSNIPRMNKVAEIVQYQEKRFNGLGPPDDSSIQGEEIPFGARMLKVALDFDSLVLENPKEGDAFGRLEERKGWYDPQVIDALRRTLGRARNYSMMNLPLKKLSPGMVVPEGIVDQKDRLVIPKGQELSQWLISHLLQLHYTQPIKEPIVVQVPIDENC